MRRPPTWSTSSTPRRDADSHAMTPMQTAAVASPELLLVGATLILLVWGAFQGKASAAFTFASMGGLILDQGAVFSKVVIYLASAAAIPLGEGWFARRGQARFEFPILVIIAA